MEKQKRSSRQGRRKFQLNMSDNAGGSGIGGVVVWGGALAIASLVAAFTIKKGRKDSDKDTTNSAVPDSVRKKADGSEGLRFILQDSSSTLHQTSCCTNHGTSKIGITQIQVCELVSTQSLTSEENTMQCEEKDSHSVNAHQESLISDTEQYSIAITDDYGDIQELSRPVVDHFSLHQTMNMDKNETNESSVMETIEIEVEDEAVDADAKQMAEEESTLQSSLSSVSPTEEEKYSPKQLSFSTEEEEEEEEYSLMQSLFSTEEEDEEEYSLMQSLFSTEEEDEEEYSPMQSSFSTEEDVEGYSPVESSFSTEEEEEEEEDSPLQSSFSTEDEDDEGEDVTEMEEESSEGTGSSSAESNVEAIWPAEMMKSLSPESKEMNISHRISEAKDTTAKMEAYNYLANMFDESGSNNGKNKKETQELVVMNDQKEHSAAKPQIWVWLGLVLLLLLLLANCLLQPNYLFNSVSFVFPMK